MGRKAGHRRLWVDYGLTIVAAVLIALAIRFYLIEAYRIPSPAMRPSLLAGDTIFVSKWDYSIGAPKMPERGEVIVFSPLTDRKLNFIKRVVGLPGEIVEVRNGRVSINGAFVTELEGSCGTERPGPGVSYEVCRDRPVLEDFPAEKVPQDSVFVIGDLRSQNKGESRRNRSWGIIPVSSIKGQARWIWLSIQPRELKEPQGWLPKIRWSRMFRRIQ